MKLIASLLGFNQKNEFGIGASGNKTIAEYQRELLVKAGRQQFKKLDELGLSIPVALS